MTQESRVFTTDLAIIGSGLAGFAASTFAMEKGINTAQAGNTGAVAYTTGYLDLLGHSCENSTELVNRPWDAIHNLRTTQPKHPLCRISEEDILKAFKRFTGFLGNCGIAYSEPGDTNIAALSPVGTFKPTFCVPATMQEGVKAFNEKSNCVIIGFKGLRGFSAHQIAANLRKKWPGLRAEQVNFPDMDQGDIYPEVMARALESPRNREKLAKIIGQIIGDAEVLGLPAVLGVHSPDFVMSEMKRLIGCPLFEIPTMPPSIPGIRLREMFEQEYPQKGLTLIPQQKVRAVDFTANKVTLSLADNFGPITIHAKAVILATGRFLSGGLHAHIDGISETLLNLPVTQPENRDKWYNMTYIGKQEHQIHKCGIEVDDSFRPLNENGKIVDCRLFAAGIILAHQDWIRGHCGAGVAITSAYKAVENAEQVILNNKRRVAKN
ncbi:MAG: anaerobic glycerol-3-phosphate dehydrogenase subunit B [Bacteroidetes bacterium]|nr:anaerobic glycerol-3-phosphate dehydrogenase subunit B [Bacteroidota bacterium]